MGSQLGDVVAILRIMLEIIARELYVLFTEFAKSAPKKSVSIAIEAVIKKYAYIFEKIPADAHAKSWVVPGHVYLMTLGDTLGHRGPQLGFVYLVIILIVKYVSITMLHGLNDII